MICKPEIRNIEVELPILEVIKEKADKGPKQAVNSPPAEKVEPPKNVDGKLPFEVSKDENLVIDSLARNLGPQQLSETTLTRSVRDGILRIYEVDAARHRLKK